MADADMGLHMALREIFHAHLGVPGWGFLRKIAKDIGTVSEELREHHLDALAVRAEQRLVNVMDPDKLRVLLEQVRALTTRKTG